MKKIFLNITYLVLSVMTLTYLFIGCCYNGENVVGVID